MINLFIRWTLASGNLLHLSFDLVNVIIIVTGVYSLLLHGLITKKSVFFRRHCDLLTSVCRSRYLVLFSKNQLLWLREDIVEA